MSSACLADAACIINMIPVENTSNCVDLKLPKMTDSFKPAAKVHFLFSKIEAIINKLSEVSSSDAFLTFSL